MRVVAAFLALLVVVSSKGQTIPPEEYAKVKEPLLLKSLVTMHDRDQELRHAAAEAGKVDDQARLKILIPQIMEQDAW